MFPLSDGKLIRLNKDGTSRETIVSDKSNIVFGTRILCDHQIKDAGLANDVECEISTDNCGRIHIINKSENDIYLDGSNMEKKSMRPLFTNNIIKICDGVEFKWIYNHAKENNADFASYSDPGKRLQLIKQARKVNDRPKGRLTHHPIYSIPKMNADNDKKDDEVNDGCPAIHTNLNDSVFAVTPNDVPNVTAQLVDVSQALINLDETQPVASCEHTEETVLMSNEIVAANLLEFNVPSEEPAENSVNIVKVQPSDCSVITVSSDESQAASQEIHNKSMEDKDMFARSIACPPSQPPEDLLDNCSPENDEQQMDTTSSYNLNDDKENDTDTTDEVNILAENVTIKAENEMAIKKSPRRTSFLVESTQAIEANTSIEEMSTNDDSIVIPETQLLSQDDVELSQPTSVISLSSDEETHVEQTEDENTSNTDDLFASDEHTDNVDTIIEASTALIEEENSEEIQQSKSIHETEAVYSDELVEDVNKSVVAEAHDEDGAQLPKDSSMLPNDEFHCELDENDDFLKATQMTSSEATDTAADLLESIAFQHEENSVESEEHTIDECLLLNIEKSTDVASLLNNDETLNVSHQIEIAPTQTVSSISQDITQELDLQAFHSELTDDEPMDKLVFSDSTIESDDSGNDSTSCAYTSTIATESSQTNLSTAKSSDDVSTTEIQIARTPSKSESDRDAELDEQEHSASLDMELASTQTEGVGECDALENLSDVETATSATPAKLSTTESDASVTRSTRYALLNAGTSSVTCTPRKLNLTLTVPNELDSLSIVKDSKSGAEMNIESVESEVIDIANDAADNLVSSTPAKVATKPDDIRSSTLGRSTKRKPNIIDSESATQRSTPRKLNVSLAMNTLFKTETDESKVTQESVESTNIENEAILIEEGTSSDEPAPKEIVEKQNQTTEAYSQESPIESILVRDETSNEITEEQIVDETTQTEANVSTLAKAKLVVDSVKCSSAVIPPTRTKRKCVQIDCIATPERVSRRINAKFASVTPIKTKKTESQLKISMSEPIQQSESVHSGEERLPSDVDEQTVNEPTSDDTALVESEQTHIKEEQSNVATNEQTIDEPSPMEIVEQSVEIPIESTEAKAVDSKELTVDQQSVESTNTENEPVLVKDETAGDIENDHVIYEQSPEVVTEEQTTDETIQIEATVSTPAKAKLIVDSVKCSSAVIPPTRTKRKCVKIDCIATPERVSRRINSIFASVTPIKMEKIDLQTVQSEEEKLTTDTDDQTVNEPSIDDTMLVKSEQTHIKEEQSSDAANGPSPLTVAEKSVEQPIDSTKTETKSQEIDKSTSVESTAIKVNESNDVDSVSTPTKIELIQNPAKYDSAIRSTRSRVPISRFDCLATPIRSTRRVKATNAISSSVDQTKSVKTETKTEKVAAPSSDSALAGSDTANEPTQTNDNTIQELIHNIEPIVTPSRKTDDVASQNTDKVSASITPTVTKSARTSARSKRVKVEMCIVPLEMDTAKEKQGRKIQTNEAVTVEAEAKKTEVKEAEVSPSTSNSSAKRGTKRARIAKIVDSNIETVKMSNVDDLVAAVLSENAANSNKTDIDSESTMSKRISTPIPAAKRRRRLPSAMSKSIHDSGESSKSMVQTVTDIDNKIDAIQDNDAAAIVSTKGRSTRRKQQDNDVNPKEDNSKSGGFGTPVQKVAKFGGFGTPVEEDTKSGGFGTPANKRHRKLAIESSKDDVPNTSGQGTKADEVLTKSENTSAIVRTTRRKRINSEIESALSTPNIVKTQISHITTEIAITPSSLRSLRNRTISLVDLSSITTPKMSRQQRLASNVDVNSEKRTVKTPKQKEKEDEKPAEVVEKPKGRRGRKPAAKVIADEPKESAPETKSSAAIESESIELVTEDKKPKRGTKRARTQSVTSVENEKANEEKEVQVKAGRRTRKNSHTQAQAQAQIVDLTVDTPLKVIPEVIEPSVEKKPRRGRPKKVVVEENEPTVKPETSDVPESSTTKRAVRFRAASKSEETFEKIKDAADKIEKPTANTTDVPIIKPAKNRGKRTRKMENEPEPETEVQPPQKRTRNTKKTKEVDPKEEPSTKGSATEKQTRKTKKAAESNDADDANSTPPISKRTRRHK